jgi:hypothetical protein
MTALSLYSAERFDGSFFSYALRHATEHLLISVVVCLRGGNTMSDFIAINISGIIVAGLLLLTGIGLQ